MAIIKIDRKKINFLEKDFSKKLGNDFKIYRPKYKFQIADNWKW